MIRLHVINGAYDQDQNLVRPFLRPHIASTSLIDEIICHMMAWLTIIVLKIETKFAGFTDVPRFRAT